MTRRFGWKPDKTAPEMAKWWRGRLKGVAIVPDRPSSYTKMDGVIAAVNQGRSSTCAAQAVASGMELILKLRYPDAPRSSARYLYRRALELDVAEKRSPGIKDDGTWLSSVTRVIRDTGWPAESRWRWDKGPPTQPIPASVVLHTHDQIHSLEADGLWTPTRAQMESAICQNRPVAFGSEVTTDVCDCSGWDPLDYSGPVEGGHAMLAFAYDEASFWALSSWGTGWAERGRCRISWDVLDREIVRDAIALKSCRRATS